MSHLCTGILRALPKAYSVLKGDTAGRITRGGENCRAAIGVISDLHLRETPYRKTLLKAGLYDAEKAADMLDAFVIDGDITDRGLESMWQAFAKIFRSFDTSAQDILVLGNHDTWCDGFTPEQTKQTFVKYSRICTGREIDNVYFSASVNGYPVIVLGSEGDACDAYVSQEQLDWFAAEMEKASETGKPVFVFFHQSINGTHGLPYTWEFRKDDPIENGGIGKESDRVLEIIKKYNNIFYISGHIHAGFALESEHKAYSSVERHGTYTLINVPCFIAPDKKRGGHKARGTGYILEVYDDRVLIRARNFAFGTYCAKFDVEVPLNKCD